MSRMTAKRVSRFLVRLAAGSFATIQIAVAANICLPDIDPSSDVPAIPVQRGGHHGNAAAELCSDDFARGASIAPSITASSDSDVPVETTRSFSPTYERWMFDLVLVALAPLPGGPPRHILFSRFLL